MFLPPLLLGHPVPGCSQPVTELDGADSETPPSLVEQYRYRSDISVPTVVAELSLYKEPAALARLGFPLTDFSRRQTPSEFVFVTAADDHFVGVAADAIGVVQALFPRRSIYFFDLSGGVLDCREHKVMQSEFHYRQNTDI